MKPYDEYFGFPGINFSYVPSVSMELNITLSLILAMVLWDPFYRPRRWNFFGLGHDRERLQPIAHLRLVRRRPTAVVPAEISLHIFGFADLRRPIGCADYNAKVCVDQ